MSIRVRDLLAVVEAVGPHLSDQQICNEIDRLIRLAGDNDREMPFNIERCRDERDLSGAAPRKESA